MTTYAENDTRTSTGWPLFAALGAGTALVLSAVGTFWDLTGNDSVHHGGSEYWPVVAIVLVATAVVFGLVVRPASADSAATRAVVLSVVGFLSLVVFWSGLPPVLAFGAIALALKAPGMPTQAKVALGISVLTLALTIVVAIVG